MDTSVSSSKDKFFLLNVRTRETLGALAFVAVISISYLLLASSPSTGLYGSFLPPQIRTFLGISAVSSADDDYNLRSQAQHYERPLERMLQEASMPNRTVIITTLNAAWAENNSMIDMFLESFQNGEGTQKLLKHLIIVCLDQIAYNRCLTNHPHCIKIKTEGVDFSGEQALLSKDYIKMIWRRIKFLKAVLEMNYSFIFTDTDVLWFRDPLPLLEQDPEADLQMACDRYNGRFWDVRNSPNAGFTYVRANERTLQFYNYWYRERNRDAKMADQEVFNVIKYEDEFKQIGMKIRFLDTQFIGGFCAIRFTDMAKAFTMHATCCKGLSNKLSDLRMILDEWKEWKQSNPKIASMTPFEVQRTRKRRGRGRIEETITIVPAINTTNMVPDPHFTVPRLCPKTMPQRKTKH